jgi:hypothetical protein
MHVLGKEFSKVLREEIASQKILLSHSPQIVNAICGLNVFHIEAGLREWIRHD